MLEKPEKDLMTRIAKTEWIGLVENVLKTSKEAAYLLTSATANVLVYC
jgi:hypothetical protein